MEKESIHPKYTLNYKAAYYQKRKTFKYLFTIRASPHATEMKKISFLRKIISVNALFNKAFKTFKK